jgi:TonB family protein
MPQSKPITPVTGRVSAPNAGSAKQQRLMLAALVLLVITLVSVLYHNRDFWFPDEQQAQEQPQPKPGPVATSVTPATPAPQKQAPAHSKQKHRAAIAEVETPSDPPPPLTVTRSVLPPLEVEVVAGDSHRKLHPKSNSLQVELEGGSSPLVPVPTVPSEAQAADASVIKAADRVDVSPQAASLVTHSVSPSYPLLARQMKVQGSVILNAVIGRDGLIQDLHVVSGPPILAHAAQEAVRQWRFKPHLVGSEPVETQAKISVNFTISTN